MSPTRTREPLVGRPGRARRMIALAAVALVLAGCAKGVAGQAMKVGAAAGTGSSAAGTSGPTGPKAGVTPADVLVDNDGRTQSDARSCWSNRPTATRAVTGGGSPTGIRNTSISIRHGAFAWCSPP